MGSYFYVLEITLWSFFPHLMVCYPSMTDTRHVFLKKHILPVYLHHPPRLPTAFATCKTVPPFRHFLCADQRKNQVRDDYRVNCIVLGDSVEPPRLYNREQFTYIFWCMRELFIMRFMQEKENSSWRTCMHEMNIFRGGKESYVACFSQNSRNINGLDLTVSSVSQPVANFQDFSCHYCGYYYHI